MMNWLTIYVVTATGFALLMLSVWGWPALVGFFLGTGLVMLFGSVLA